jgi:hypothetical protein
MEELLKQARKEYPKGSLFISATNSLKTPFKVHSLKVSENYRNTIVDTEAGVIYTNGIWAVKC